MQESTEDHPISTSRRKQKEGGESRRPTAACMAASAGKQYRNNIGVIIMNQLLVAVHSGKWWTYENQFRA